MAEWSSCTEVDARPEDVLGVLCDPLACRRWSPVELDHALGRIAAEVRA